MGKNSHYSKGDSELEALTVNLPSRKDEVLSVQAIRDRGNPRWDALGKKAKCKAPFLHYWRCLLRSSVENVVFGDVQIPVKGGSIVGYTYRPAQDAGGEKTYPLLVNCHGISGALLADLF
jgi:hypothetical protein